jgi:hypothetical protein
MSSNDDYSAEERRRELNNYYDRLDEQRRQDLNDYHDRLDDQEYERRRQEEISEALHEGLRTGNFSKFYLKLGVVPPNTAETAALPAQSPPQPTAFDQFLEHSAQLKATLESATCLPNAVAANWVRSIQSINFMQPTAGLATIHHLLAEYEQARYDYKPQRDIFDLKVYETFQFEQEMAAIKFELDWLKAILEHVEKFLKNPF